MLSCINEEVLRASFSCLEIDATREKRSPKKVFFHFCYFYLPISSCQVALGNDKRDVLDEKRDLAQLTLAHDPAGAKLLRKYSKNICFCDQKLRPKICGKGSRTLTFSISTSDIGSVSPHRSYCKVVEEMCLMYGRACCASLFVLISQRYFRTKLFCAFRESCA